MKIENSSEAGTESVGVYDPTTEHQLWDTEFMLTNNSTKMIPLNWSVREAHNDGKYVDINRVSVNGIETDNLTVKALNGKDFRVLL
jgi:hypothetical protein